MGLFDSKYLREYKTLMKQIDDLNEKNTMGYDTFKEYVLSDEIMMSYFRQLKELERKYSKLHVDSFEIFQKRIYEQLNDIYHKKIKEIKSIKDKEEQNKKMLELKQNIEDSYGHCCDPQLDIVLDDLNNRIENTLKSEVTEVGKSEYVNPYFAETLMSTFYAGGDFSDEDYKKCNKIWEENNNDRSKVLKIVVDLCGSVDTPQARYIRAIAWSFNRVEFSEQRIKAINDYLNNELYKKAYENLVVSIENGIEYGERVHKVIMLQYLASAYCHLKMYKEEEETYLKIYNLHIVIPNGCVSLAKYYAKRGNREKAIQLLKEEKNTSIYKNNSEYRSPINEYLEELEKKQRGINKHIFIGYDTYQSAFIGDKYYPELEKKGMKLREKYKQAFENHRTFLENIDQFEYELKSNNAQNIDENKAGFVSNCLSDINLYPIIQEYYKELNSIGYEYKIEYQDKSSHEYPIFRKLISFYEKEKKYTDAIDLCNIAISYGITKYFGKTTIIEKKKKLEDQNKK